MIKMRRLILIGLIGIVSASAQLFPNLGGQRVGTSAAQFLKIGVGARAIALGESYVALANDASALYWNPAGISQFNQHDLFFNYNQWFADIKITYTGAVVHLNSINSIGVFFSTLSTDEMRETTELQPMGTGRTFIYGDLLGGLTYARNMTDKFSFGVTVKYLSETLAELKMNAVLFDLGTYYKTGWKSTRFAVAVTNFAPEIGPHGSFSYKDLQNKLVRVNDFQKFTPPIIFRIGLAAELLETARQKITGSVQLNHPNDNSENLNFGVEYWIRQLASLRCGYITSREDRDLSVGLGLNLPMGKNRLRLDYSFANFGRLGFVSQYSMHVNL